MALDFPSGPTVGQAYSGYIYDGEKWVSQGATPNAVRYDLPQGLTANQTAQARANIWVTKKNYVINGGMQVSQENGTVASVTSGQYPVDCFSVVYPNTSAVLSYAQVVSTTPSGSSSRLRITVTTADATVAATDYIQILHAFEGLRVMDLQFGTSAAKTVTLQFGCRGPAGTYCVSLSNFASTRVYVAEYTIAAGEANTDVLRSITIPGDTTGSYPFNTSGCMLLHFTLMTGTTYQTTTPGSWGSTNVLGTSNQFNFAGTANNVFELFDVSLTEGAVAPPFQVPDYASELTLCQRYWERDTGILVSPGASSIVVLYPFKVTKRANPTVTYSGVAYTNASGLAVNTVTVNSVGIQINAATAGGYATFTFTASIRL